MGLLISDRRLRRMYRGGHGLPARPHVPVTRQAPEESVAALAGRYPVFRVDRAPRRAPDRGTDGPRRRDFRPVPSRGRSAQYRR